MKHFALILTLIFLSGCTSIPKLTPAQQKLHQQSKVLVYIDSSEISSHPSLSGGEIGILIEDSWREKNDMVLKDAISFDPVSQTRDTINSGASHQWFNGREIIYLGQQDPEQVESLINQYDTVITVKLSNRVTSDYTTVSVSAFVEFFDQDKEIYDTLYLYNEQIIEPNMWSNDNVDELVKHSSEIDAVLVRGQEQMFQLINYDLNMIAKGQTEETSSVVYENDEYIWQRSTAGILWSRRK